MERAKGILYAALSSSTFGLAPLFTLLLLGLGYSAYYTRTLSRIAEAEKGAGAPAQKP